MTILGPDRVDLSDRTVALPYQGRPKDGRRARIGPVVLRTEAEQGDCEELTGARAELRSALPREVRSVSRADPSAPEPTAR
ncbi:hypothetical protein [Streptomyces sp. TLI_171]|uniref:hypothetical protein n=1 Tax=Streptomyces sp. TLI_171 TaxID=1938859 RepID=UPI000C198821|nr:hypothetical protein [Streptomyces sp. TLI_171]RKE18233.1 hypothetical protein BX266_1517 [Streptomyces sp. TLI_171]